jgi:hypothetical protein
MNNKHAKVFALHLKGFSYREIARKMNHPDVNQGFIAWKMVKEVEHILATFK